MGAGLKKRPGRERGPTNKGSASAKGKGKVGAQPGNFNTLKHGFYSRRFQAAEVADLDLLTAQVGDVDQEITMLRVAMRRVMSRLKEQTKKDGTFVIEEQAALMEALSKGTASIASLTRAKAALLMAQRALDQKPGDTLDEALKRMADKMGLH